jgi:hypothetical protein
MGSEFKECFEGRLLQVKNVIFMKNRTVDWRESKVVSEILIVKEPGDSSLPLRCTLPERSKLCEMRRFTV